MKQPPTGRDFFSIYMHQTEKLVRIRKENWICNIKATIFINYKMN